MSTNARLLRVSIPSLDIVKEACGLTGCPVCGYYYISSGKQNKEESMSYRRLLDGGQHTLP
jgi:hypothetical protein